jgi:hypothetical protein
VQTRSGKPRNPGFFTNSPEKNLNTNSIFHDSTFMNEVTLDQLLSGTGILEQPKASNTKTSESNAAKTLESYHSLNFTRIREEQTKLPELKKQLAVKKAEFHELETLFQSPSPITSNNEIAALTSRQRIEAEIAELHEKIQAIENGETEADYFLRVGDILFSYTDAQDRIAAGHKTADPFASKKTRMPANSVYSYFTNGEDITEFPAYPAYDAVAPEVAASASTASTAATTSSKAAAVTSDIGFHRDKALECYLSALDPNNVQHEAAVMSSLEENFGSCPVCDTEMLFNETFLDCKECGYREYILIDSEKPSYKDPPREMSYYAYKKINHLNEWLAQFQAKETTDIPAAVLEQIRAELKKERITDMSKLKISKLKEILKKLKLSRWYDHVAHILNRLNGISAPVLSREVEEKLRYMFKEIQFSFVKHCPKKRSNFLSYSFVLYKFCELLELDEYLPCFPLLKSREKLYMQDKIWELICKDLGWQFIRTV